jgi:hypothetical protein
MSMSQARAERPRLIFWRRMLVHTGVAPGAAGRLTGSLESLLKGR